MTSGHGINWLISMKQRVTAISESRGLKMSLLQFIIDITKGDCLSGSKTMKMLSQNLFYLEKGFGMMMAARNFVLFRMPRILAWWIPYLKN
jgi:hypothetical protein